MEIYISNANWSGVSYRTAIEPQTSVLVETLQNDVVIDMRKFTIGDIAVIYTMVNGYTVMGRIESIGKKSITLRDRGDDAKRMSPQKFAAFNFDFDIARIKADNYNAVMNT